LGTEQDQKVVELTRLIIDLKLEKKQYNKEMNDKIKENEAEIAELVKE
jgi:phage host-nuclease inhibitor protein Gam